MSCCGCEVGLRIRIYCKDVLQWRRANSVQGKDVLQWLRANSVQGKDVQNS